MCRTFPRLALSLLLLCTGCLAPRPTAARPDETGFLWLFPGVESRSVAFLEAVRGLREGGVTSEVQYYNWPLHLRPLDDLTNLDRNRREAARVAGQIAQQRRTHPQRPIDLIGYSGGGGMALLVAEHLPDEIRLRHIVLVQPAVSRDYNLSTALSHCEGRIVNFYSPRDWLILGWGTTVFGTMDRRRTVSAGKEGFLPSAAIPDVNERHRLQQVAWTNDMAATGHVGHHLGILLCEWNRRYVAPWLADRTRSWP